MALSMKKAAAFALFEMAGIIVFSYGRSFPATVVAVGANSMLTMKYFSAEGNGMRQ